MNDYALHHAVNGAAGDEMLTGLPVALLVAKSSIPLTVTQPDITQEILADRLFADLLGQGTSQVSGSSNRKFNVKLSAEACNGVILMPGEEFSYNNTTGSRSADKGYLPAPVYSGGASVDETGGGICQTSSTIYYAVLHTTLEIVERHAHMYSVGYVLTAWTPPSTSACPTSASKTTPTTR